MRAAAFALSSVIVVGIAAWFALDTPDRAPRSRASHAETTEQGAVARAGVVEGIEVDRLDYRLSLKREVSVGGTALPALNLSADLSRIPLVHRRGRIEMTLSDVSVSGPHGTPDAAALLAPFHVGRTPGNGLLAGFQEAVSPQARELLGTVVSAIQFSPGEGAGWSVLEEDVNGRYEAQYRRRADNTVERTRKYLGLRTAAGFDPRRAYQLTVDGATVFEHDARGLVSVQVNETATVDIGHGQDLRAVITVRLERNDAAKVAGRFGAQLPLEALVQASARTKEGDHDAALLGDHTAETLIAAFTELDALPTRSHETSKWRNTQLLRLRALVRKHPEAADTLTQEIIDRAQTGDSVPIDLLVGSLAEAQTIEGRDALMTLAQDREIDSAVRRRVAMGLGRLDQPTGETSAMLAQMVEEGGMGSTPALALGNQARPLADSEPEAAQDAVDLLIERYLATADLGEKRMYLNALGNAGDPRILPLVQEALAGPLAVTAAYCLRFIPSNDADALLMGIIGNPGSSQVRAAAVRATGVRSAATWQPILMELLGGEQDAVVKQAVTQVLATMPTT